MASTAEASSKKRYRTKDRQRRKARQQNQFADPGSEVTTTMNSMTIHEAIAVGDASRTEAISITDAGVEKLAKAYPNLAVVKLHGTRNLWKKAFPAVLRNCAVIQAVTITVEKGHTSRKTILTSFLNWLIDKEFVRHLRYLEFRGVY
ncbi:hypothetical protein CC86DRAFT_404569 [Ophiobolus disseminans]|uniref:Uncharacterized protein n=1 Tax=Ophiobolus disseminans TaxID=1469910 RepID=A0A6A7A7B2_9PLEO|nr:hypothetical protein CC86DRAFT_404569 [Ophiobolus disseminans]